MTTPKNAGKPIKGCEALVKILKFNEQGLMPTIIQDAESKQVLTLCYLNLQALQKSLETGMVYLFRRSQNKLMQKGETSGHIQIIKEVLADCEGKSLVFQIEQHVAACHAGYFTCYFRKLNQSGIIETVGSRVFDPAKVY